VSHDPQSPTDAADFDDDSYESDDDEEEDDFECGAFINGRFDYAGCQLAGTEDCDWECPYSASVRGPRK
jgi:hypothetical protein